MNNKNFKEYVDSNKNHKLTDQEKSDIFNNVSKFVDQSPTYSTNNKKYAMVATLLLVGVGAGTSFAASNSLPGSLLYPLKDEFNKKVLGISEDTALDSKAVIPQAEINSDLSDSHSYSLGNSKAGELKPAINKNKAEISIQVSSSSSFKDINTLSATSNIDKAVSQTAGETKVIINNALPVVQPSLPSVENSSSINISHL